MSQKFVAKDKDGKEITFFLKKPTSKDYTDAKIHSNSLAVTLLNQKTPEGKPAFLVKSQVGDYLRSQGLWNDEKEDRLKKLSEDVRSLSRKLARGGIKKSEGKEIAIKIIKTKKEQLLLLSDSRQLDQYTMESQVENANFDYLVSVCLLDEEGNRVFNNVEEYKENADTIEVYSAVEKFASILYNIDSYSEKDEPEWKFLIKYGFANDKLQLINKDGKTVDEDGRLINEDGRYITEDGLLVDSDGNRVDENGDPIEEFTEFLDD